VELTSNDPVSLKPAPKVPDSPEVLQWFHETLDLVDVIAMQLRRTLGSHTEYEELVASGREGLLEAARRYDPARGVPFRLYANYRVRGAMVDGIRRAAPLPRRLYEQLRALQASSEVSEGSLDHVADPAQLPQDLAEAEDLLAEHLSSMAMGAALAALSARAGDEDDVADDATGPEEAVAHAEVVAKVKAALDELSPEAAAVVRRHFLDGEQLETIARDYSMSKSWASRLLTRTTARLAKRLHALA
jgi:RNA polymerase sigma factor for flagellar operon FliA